MKLSIFSKILTSLYTDTIDVFTYNESMNEDGSVGIVRENKAKYRNISCRLSFDSSDNPLGMTEEKNPIYLQVKVFCDVNYKIKKGDLIKAKRLQDDGSVLGYYQGEANEAFIFPTHQEILFTHTGEG